MSKPGWVYVLESEPVGDNEVRYYKIGMTTDLDSRMAQIPLQLPFKVSVCHVIQCADARLEEARLHEILCDHRVNGEWFELPDDVLQSLKSIDHLPTRSRAMMAHQDGAVDPVGGDEVVDIATEASMDFDDFFTSPQYLVMASDHNIISQSLIFIDGLRQHLRTLGTYGLCAYELGEMTTWIYRALLIAADETGANDRLMDKLRDRTCEQFERIYWCSKNPIEDYIKEDYPIDL